MNEPRSRASILPGKGRARSPLRAVNRHEWILQICSGQGPAGSLSLDVYDSPDWPVNPKGCQKVAGGRAGQRGTTTGRPRKKTLHPEAGARTAAS
jgi:hypothetical protein